MGDYYRGKKYSKPVSQEVVYEFDVSDFLQTGDSVDTPSVPTVSGITTSIESTEAESVFVKISGGTKGDEYSINMLAPTANGEAIDMLIVVVIPDP